MKSRWRAFWDAYVELFDLSGQRCYRRMRREMAKARAEAYRRHECAWDGCACDHESSGRG
jgi:hypothetical protein